ncbi:MAG: hypothetical protein V3W52_17215 [Syntrophobacteria bacterium]
MGDLVRLGNVTTLDLPVDLICDSAKQLEGIVILGYDEEGEEYFASSYGDKKEVLWLLRRLEKQLLEQ